MPGDHDIEYTDEFITKLQIAFGKGFLSPGGMEEVARIVEGIDLNGKKVLDIGVGIGGPACLLVTSHGAGKVTGIDVEEPVLKEAQATVSSQNLQNQIDLQLVEPGPLPFDDATFDIVFSKDSIIHISDKRALFGEVYRVLKPGGVLLLSVPLLLDRRENLLRAEVSPDGSIIHHETPEFHGDPLNEQGCLAFHHFAWALLDDMRDSGFSRVEIVKYWSPWLGFFGADQVIVLAKKDGDV